MTLNADKYRCSVSLQCSTCGNTDFSHGDTDDLLTCTTCGLEITKDDLIRANSRNIEAHVQEIGEEVVADVRKELHETLKNAFRGSRSIKVR